MLLKGVCVYIRIYVYTYTYMMTSVCICIYMYVHMSLSLYIYIYIHIHMFILYDFIRGSHRVLLRSYSELRIASRGNMFACLTWLRTMSAYLTYGFKRCL